MGYILRTRSRLQAICLGGESIPFLPFLTARKQHCNMDGKMHFQIPNFCDSFSRDICRDLWLSSVALKCYNVKKCPLPSWKTTLKFTACVVKDLHKVTAMQLTLNVPASARCGIRQHKTPSLQNNNNNNNNNNKLKVKTLFTSYRYDFHSSTKHNIFTMLIKSVFRHYSNILETMYLYLATSKKAIKQLLISNQRFHWFQAPRTLSMWQFTFNWRLKPRKIISHYIPHEQDKRIEL